jgi:ArsR family transcriptional regulator, arsenate/arsenite/antimonite-responsive transcriptional repressor
VTVERESRHLFYRPALDRMNELLGFLTDHCCQGQRCGTGKSRRRTTC